MVLNLSTTLDLFSSLRDGNNTKWINRCGDKSLDAFARHSVCECKCAIKRRLFLLLFSQSEGNPFYSYIVVYQEERRNEFAVTMINQHRERMRHAYNLHIVNSINQPMDRKYTYDNDGEEDESAKKLNKIN